MRKLILLFVVQLILLIQGMAQPFKLDTLQYKGDINKYINIVIMGDGYTAKEQNTFAADAKSLFNYIFTQPPWSGYAGYFNAFAIRVISEESGAKHPNTAADCGSASTQVPVSNPKTYFGCSFDSYNIHRLVVPNNVVNIVNVLSAQFPAYDQVLIIANSPYYGGSGGSFATSTKETSSPEIIAHELAHSFANLADEYYAGDQYASERANMTRVTDSQQVKWKNWMGVNLIGIFQHCCGGNSSQWYKPHESCKMQFLGRPFCSVCAETIVERIHSMVNPIAAYQPQSATINSADRFIRFKLTELMKPLPNTLKISWNLNGTLLSGKADSLVLDQNMLAEGLHKLTVSVVDTSTLVRIDKHATIHSSMVTWNINKTATNVRLRGTDNRIGWSVYPNPASDVLNVSFEADRRTDLSVRIISTEGKTIRLAASKTRVDGHFFLTIPIADLPSGVYLLRFEFDNSFQSRLFVKK